MSPDALSVAEPEGIKSKAVVPRDLPGGWCWASLAEIVAINPPTNFDSLPDGAEVPFIPMAAVASC
jgi:hypothetical protein